MEGRNNKRENMNNMNNMNNMELNAACLKSTRGDLNIYMKGRGEDVEYESGRKSSNSNKLYKRAAHTKYRVNTGNTDAGNKCRNTYREDMHHIYIPPRQQSAFNTLPIKQISSPILPASQISTPTSQLPFHKLDKELNSGKWSERRSKKLSHTSSVGGLIGNRNSKFGQIEEINPHVFNILKMKKFGSGVSTIKEGAKLTTFTQQMRFRMNKAFKTQRLMANNYKNLAECLKKDENRIIGKGGAEIGLLSLTPTAESLLSGLCKEDWNTMNVQSSLSPNLPSRLLVSQRLSQNSPYSTEEKLTSPINVDTGLEPEESSREMKYIGLGGDCRGVNSYQNAHMHTMANSNLHTSAMNFFTILTDVRDELECNHQFIEEKHKKEEKRKEERELLKSRGLIRDGKMFPYNEEKKDDQNTKGTLLNLNDILNGILSEDIEPRPEVMVQHLSELSKVYREGIRKVSQLSESSTDLLRIFEKIWSIAMLLFEMMIKKQKGFVVNYIYLCYQENIIRATTDQSEDIIAKQANKFHNVSERWKSMHTIQIHTFDKMARAFDRLKRDKEQCENFAEKCNTDLEKAVGAHNVLAMHRIIAQIDFNLNKIDDEKIERKTNKFIRILKEVKHTHNRLVETNRKITPQKLLAMDSKLAESSCLRTLKNLIPKLYFPSLDVFFLNKEEKAKKKEIMMGLRSRHTVEIQTDEITYEDLLIEAPDTKGRIQDNTIVKIIKSNAKKVTKINALQEPHIMNILETFINDHFKYEKENNNKDVEIFQSIHETDEFPSYLYQRMIMKYGLKTITIKALLSLKKGLDICNERKLEYAIIYMKLLGLDKNSYDQIEQRLVRRSIAIFNEAQELWVKVKNLAPYSPEIINIRTGGIVPILRLTELLEKIIGKHQDPLFESAKKHLYPHEFKKIHDHHSQQAFQFKFIKYKVAHFLHKLGRTAEEFFRLANPHPNQSEPKMRVSELAQVIEQRINKFVTKGEALLLAEKLDREVVGYVTLEEFTSNIVVNETAENEEIYLMTKTHFIACMLEVWHEYQQAKSVELKEIFIKFDANHDGVLTLAEFEKLIRSYKPDMKSERITQLFTETLDYEESDNPDRMSPEAFCAMVIRRSFGLISQELYSLYLKSSQLSNRKMSTISLYLPATPRIPKKTGSFN